MIYVFYLRVILVFMLVVTVNEGKLSAQRVIINVELMNE